MSSPGEAGDGSRPWANECTTNKQDWKDLRAKEMLAMSQRKKLKHELQHVGRRGSLSLMSTRPSVVCVTETKQCRARLFKDADQSFKTSTFVIQSGKRSALNCTELLTARS